MKILITEKNYSKQASLTFQKVGEVIYGNSDWKFILDSIPEIDVMAVKLGFNFNQDFFEHAKKLKYIVTSTTGTNHISLPQNSNIKIISLKGETKFLKNITPTAEHTWALILSLIRKVPNAVESVKKFNWDRDHFIGTELKGKILGIIGLGRIGTMVAKIGTAFGMHIKFYDINDIASEDLDPNIIEATLEEVLSSSDILSLHIPSSESNKNFLNKELLSKLKSSAYIINTSRGDVIDELFLLRMLEEKKISGVALDVLSDENLNDKNWIKENALIKFARSGNNLLITPHIGGACEESMKLTEDFISEKFYNLLNINK